MEIRLPVRDTVQSWTNFIADNFNHQSGEKIVYDLANLEQLRPHHLVAWACLIEHQSLFFKARYLKGHEKISASLDELGFIDFFDRTKKDERVSSGKSLKLWRIIPEGIHLYPWEVQRFFEENTLRGKDLQVLNITLSELLNNIIDHSGPATLAFTATKFFFDVEVPRIETAVCDLGPGIPNNVKSYFKENKGLVLSSEEALEWAMQYGHSTKSTPRNRGYGLDHLSSVIRKLEGELKIITNEVVLHQSGKSSFEIDVLPKPFPGTLIQASFDAKMLGEKEDFEDTTEDIF